MYVVSGPVSVNCSELFWIYLIVFELLFFFSPMFWENLEVLLSVQWWDMALSMNGREQTFPRWRRETFISVCLWRLFFYFCLFPPIRCPRPPYTKAIVVSATLGPAFAQTLAFSITARSTYLPAPLCVCVCVCVCILSIIHILSPTELTLSNAKCM